VEEVSLGGVAPLVEEQVGVAIAHVTRSLSADMGVVEAVPFVPEFDVGGVVPAAAAARVLRHAIQVVQ